ncbi:hypothetical protein HK099_002102, partial [Clydaea vesicula]
MRDNQNSLVGVLNHDWWKQVYSKFQLTDDNQVYPNSQVPKEKQIFSKSKLTTNELYPKQLSNNELYPNLLINYGQENTHNNDTMNKTQERNSTLKNSPTTSVTSELLKTRQSPTEFESEESTINLLKQAINVTEKNLNLLKENVNRLKRSDAALVANKIRCKHKRIRCRECHGFGCPHGRQRSRCKEC